MLFGGLDFDEVCLADFEFQAPPGERPIPVCLVAWELVAGRKLHLWQEELRQLETAPYATGSEALFVAYYSSAELGCHLALGWPLPENVLDLYVEFRNLTNGRSTPCGRSLLGALNWFGLDSIGAAEKDDMHQLALRGGPWTPAEKAALLDYCESDVEALARLLPKMLSR
jgi:DNA polymerase-1